MELISTANLCYGNSFFYTRILNNNANLFRLTSIFNCVGYITQLTTLSCVFLFLVKVLKMFPNKFYCSLKWIYRRFIILWNLPLYQNNLANIFGMEWSKLFNKYCWCILNFCWFKYININWSLYSPNVYKCEISAILNF